MAGVNTREDPVGMSEFRPQEIEEGVWELMPGVRIRLRHIGEYTQNPANPVKHSQRNFTTVLNSVQKLGALRSGFSSKGKILGGNLTYEAMTDAGIEYVVEVESQGQTWLMHERGDLSDEQAQLAAYFDQQTSFQAAWDIEQLVRDLDGGLKLTETQPFYEEELQRILGQAANKLIASEFKEYNESIVDEREYIICPKCGERWLRE